MKLDPKLQARLGTMFAAPEGESELAGQLLLVDVERLHTGEQPRTHFDADSLRDLEGSIRELREAGKGIGGTGILQPLLVRPNGDGYLVTAGERRLRAAKAAGVPQVPVVVAEAGDEDAYEQAIIENLLRADLAPLEEAEALQRLMKSRGYSVRAAAKRLGKDKGYLENRLFLLKAPDDVREMVSARADTVRHAREIARVSDPDARRELVQAAIEGASLSATIEAVQRHLEPQAEQPSQEAPASAEAAPASGDDRALAQAQAALDGTARKLRGIGGKLPPDGAARDELARRVEAHVAQLQELVAELRE